MAQNQHYVPQSVLRRFCCADGRLWVFDKWERRVFRASPRNVAAEGGFYDLRGPDGGVYSLERALGRLEGAAAACVERILEREEVGFLTDSDRRLLGEFAAVQFLRIRNFRERFKDLSANLAQRIRDWAPSSAPEESLPPPADDHTAKVTSLKMLVDSSREYAPHFLSKALLLHVAPEGGGYWISDNPVALHNSVRPASPFLGNLGLAVQGIEVYLPLSPLATLNFLCPTIAAAILQSQDDAVHLVHALGAKIPNAERIGYLADAVRFGYSVPSSRENMEFANSLQVANAERFIFSSTKNFELAERMLEDHPDLGRGPRMRMH